MKQTRDERIMATLNRYDPEDAHEEAYDLSAVRAALDILKFLVQMLKLAPRKKGKKPIISTTYAALARQFPEHTRVMDAALIRLRDERLIAYNEHAPAPTRIYLGSEEPKQKDDINLYAFGNSFIFNSPNIGRKGMGV